MARRHLFEAWLSWMPRLLCGQVEEPRTAHTVGLVVLADTASCLQILNPRMCALARCVNPCATRSHCNRARCSTSGLMVDLCPTCAGIPVLKYVRTNARSAFSAAAWEFFALLEACSSVPKHKHGPCVFVSSTVFLEANCRAQSECHPSITPGY